MLTATAVTELPFLPPLPASRATCLAARRAAQRTVNRINDLAMILKTARSYLEHTECYIIETLCWKMEVPTMPTKLGAENNVSQTSDDSTPANK